MNSMKLSKKERNNHKISDSSQKKSKNPFKTNKIAINPQCKTRWTTPVEIVMTN